MLNVLIMLAPFIVSAATCSTGMVSTALVSPTDYTIHITMLLCMWTTKTVSYYTGLYYILLQVDPPTLM